jgi:hypothetical protein
LVIKVNGTGNDARQFVWQGTDADIRNHYPIAQGLLLCLYDQIELFDEVNGKSFLLALEGASRKEAMERLHFDKTISAKGLIATNGLTGYPGEVVRARSPVSPFPDPQEKVHCFCTAGVGECDAGGANSGYCSVTDPAGNRCEVRGCINPTYPCCTIQ